MYLYRSLWIFLSFVVANSTLVWSQKNTQTEQTLAWMKGLGEKKNKKIISGQFIDWGEYAHLHDIDSIHKTTGIWLASLAVDYHTLVINDKKLKPIGVKNTNKLILGYGSKLVNMSMHLNNPFTKGSSWDTTGALKDLWGPDSSYLRRLYSQLDSIAVGIQELEQNQVVVLLRPFHEMCGGWFWWGGYEDTASFKKLWREVYDYMVLQKKLSNILWAYSPPSGFDVLSHYPGDSWVDVVCMDVYQAKLFPGIKKEYNQLLTLNKPIGLGEYGPLSGSDINNKQGYQHNFKSFQTELEKYYPKLCFFYTWRKGFSLIHHTHVDQLLQHPTVIHREDLPSFLKK